MRLLVVSDSHRDYITLRQIVLSHPEAEKVIFLGDGLKDIDKLDLPVMKSFITVKGNCDFGEFCPTNEIFIADGVKIYCTHGQNENVKFGIDQLISYALAEGASLALYGHTHIQSHEYIDGLHIFNPGSVRNGDYGLVDITPNGIMCIGNNIRSKKNAY